MKSKLLGLTVVLSTLVVLFGVGTAPASTMVDFKITDSIVGVETFVLPLDPVPTVDVSGQFFEVDSVPVHLNGSPNTDSFEFLNLIVGGGFDDFGLGLYFLAPGDNLLTPRTQWLSEAILTLPIHTSVRVVSA